MTTEHRFIWRCGQLIAQFLMRLFFNLRVTGIEHIPAQGGVLIASNHASYLDPIALAAFLPRPLNFVAKSELFQFKLGAWFLHQLNAFPLRQGKGDVGAVKETIRRLREGHMLNIFPEGNRSPDGNLLPFQKGVALILRRANVPVIPAAIHGTYEAWPLTRKLWRISPVRVAFGAPINLDGLTTDEAITASIESEIRRLLAQAQPIPT